MNQKRDPGARRGKIYSSGGESDSNLYAFKQSAGQPCDKARGARSHCALLWRTDVFKRDG